MNKITKIEGLDRLINLELLNLHRTLISEIRGLDGLKIKKLYLSECPINEIQGLDSLATLEELDLYGDRIEEIKGLDSLINLHFLSLQENQIKEIKGLKTLKNLRSVNLSSNSILEINCTELPNAENIHLENNLILKIRGRKNYSKKKVLISFRVTNDIFVSLDEDDININIGGKATITLKNHSVFMN